MLARYTIAVVEEKSPDLDRFVQALETTGQRVLTFPPGRALEEAQQGEVDAVVCDYYQRLASGTGLLRAMRLQAPDTLRFLHTSRSQLHIAVGAVSAGAVHRYTLKSWEPLYAARSLSLALHALRPRSKNPPGVSSDMSSAEIHLSGRANSMVLVADDHVPLTKFIGRALRKHGFDVCEAYTGAQAMELATEAPPELAIVDLVMPGVSGYEIVHHLKTNHAESTHVIVMTGDSDWESELAAFRAGADDYLVKPVHVMRLLQRIERFERTRRAYFEMQLVAEESARLRAYAGEAAALLAHDIKNGLGVLSANLFFIEQSVDSDTSGGDAVRESNHMVHKLSGLVRNFVDVALSEEGALSIKPVQLELLELIEEVVKLYRPAAKDAGIVLDVHCNSGLTASLDPALIERVLHSLVTNAMRFVVKGGRVRVAAYKTSDPVAHGGSLFLEVGNSGPPISEENVPMLFERYKRSSGPRARGMGLYFCRLVAEAHDGTIALSALPGLHVNFQLKLPL